MKKIVISVLLYVFCFSFVYSTEYTTEELNSFTLEGYKNLSFKQEFLWKIREVDDVIYYRDYIISNYGEEYYDFVESFIYMRNWSYDKDVEDLDTHYFLVLLNYYTKYQKNIEQEVIEHFSNISFSHNWSPFLENRIIPWFKKLEALDIKDSILIDSQFWLNVIIYYEPFVKKDFIVKMGNKGYLILNLRESWNTKPFISENLVLELEREIKRNLSKEKSEKIIEIYSNKKPLSYSYYLVLGIFVFFFFLFLALLVQSTISKK